MNVFTKLTELAKFKEYDLKDGITVINIIQQLKQKGIEVTKADTNTLLNDVANKVNLKNVSYLDQTQTPKGLKYLPLTCDERNLYKNLNNTKSKKNYNIYTLLSGILPFDVYYSNKKGQYIKTTLVNNHIDSKINSYQLDWHLHAFEKNNKESNTLMPTPDKDLVFTYDATKDPLSKLNQIKERIIKNLETNPKLYYTYNFGTSCKPLAELTEQKLYTRGQSYIKLTDKKGNIVAILALDMIYNNDIDATSSKNKFTLLDTPMNQTFAKFFDLSWNELKTKQFKYYWYNMSELMKFDAIEDAIKQLKPKNDYKLTFTIMYDPDFYPNLLQSFYPKEDHIIDMSNHESMFAIIDPDLATEIEAAIVSYNLVKMENQTIKNDLAKSVAYLLDTQQQKFKINNTKKDKDKAWHELINQINPAMQNLLKDLDITQADHYNEFEITIKDLINYMDDIINGRPVDDKMFALITQTKTASTKIKDNKYALQQALSLNLANKIDYIDNQTKDEIQKLLPKHLHSRINHIYRIHQNKKLDGNIKTLVHGTRNISVLNILGQGLLDHNTLRKVNSSHYRYTGNGLGDGIYFARPDQIEKSLNYAGGNRHRYVFLCSVAYHKIYDTNSYDTNLNSHNCDLVWGHAVGSYDRDELVAKSPEQVRLEYIIEFN